MLTFLMAWNDFFWPIIALTSQNPTVQVALNGLGQGYVPDRSIILAGHARRHRSRADRLRPPRQADRRRDHGRRGQGMTALASPVAVPDGVRRWGAATASYQIEGASRRGRPRPVHLGHVRHTPGKASRRRHGRRRLRPLPPLPRRRRAHGRPRASAPTASRSPGRASCPEGTGRVNEAGLDFYDRLVDELLAHGIEPVRDALPLGSPAGARGRRRLAGTAPPPSAFAEYAAVVAGRARRPRPAHRDDSTSRVVGGPRLPDRDARARPHRPGRRARRRPPPAPRARARAVAGDPRGRSRTRRSASSSTSTRRTRPPGTRSTWRRRCGPTTRSTAGSSTRSPAAATREDAVARLGLAA